MLFHPDRRYRPSLAFVLLCAFLLVLWVAGGASRADALGQAIVRGAAAMFLAIMVLVGERPAFARARPVWLLLAAAIVLALAQLIPLAPGIWQDLPGRAVFTGAAAIAGQPQPWRPWSIVPHATVNAAASLIVPFLTLLLVTRVRPDEKAWLPGLVLIVIVASTLLGLLQFSGVGFDNPFINETPGVMSGPFANRNHFALFLAIGCLLVPVWVFSDGRRAHWRGPVGLGLLMLLPLTILGTGSRTGMVLGVVALGIGAVLARKGVRRELARLPRWVFPALVAAIVAMLATFVLISIAVNRAVSIQRAFSVDVEQDMRSRALPTVLEMVRAYFPAGSGLGGFDPLFRLHEPLSLLNTTYFNHAHNDLLEVVLDAGVPGLLLLAAALAWWGRASIRAWRARGGAVARLGSAVLLLVIIASIFDYPARTPMMMAIVVIAAIWLSERPQAHGA